MVGDHIGHFNEGDLVFMGPALPHVWVNDAAYLQGKSKQEADAVVVHFVEDFLGENFLCLPELEPLKKILDLSKRGLAITGKTKAEINRRMNGMIGESGLSRLSSLF